MIVLSLFYVLNIILTLSNSYEISRLNSNVFLKSKVIHRTKYEEFKELTEAKRESCLNEYRQQQKFYQKRHSLSPFCAQYCSETTDCQQNNEQSACINPSWPVRTLKYVQKIERTCYIRFTEVLQYEQAKQMCNQYGLQLAIIDNLPLVQRLHQLHMFNASCRGLCPRAKGYYIGLKRLFDSSNKTKWIWSDNVTWTQNTIKCDDSSYTSYSNGNLLCYLDKHGEKKMTIWNKGEPNNYLNREECVEILATTDKKSSFDQIGKLNDIPCTKPALGVICQGDDTKPTNSTRWKYFTTILGFNQTKTIEMNFLSKLNSTILWNFDAINSMTSTLESLLLLSSSFTNEQARKIFNIVDQLVNISGQIEIETSTLKSVTNKLLHFLDLFPQKIQIETQTNLSFQYENLHMSILDINFNNNQSSTWLKIHEQEKYSNTIIEINLDNLKIEFINDFNRYRLIEIRFLNFNLFPQNNFTQIGMPIAYHIGNFTSIKSDHDLVRYQIRIDQTKPANISCVYWSFQIDNGSWISDDSCRFVGYINNYAQCYCNHLTHFALLILSESDETSLSMIEEYILTFITYIGICLSIMGLILTLITYALYRHSQRNHLHGSLIMLCISILIVNCLYLPFHFVKSKTIFCLLIGYLFHYFFLSSFMWMLIIAIVQYIHFVRIFNTHISHFFTKTCIIGWLVPLIFPMLVLLYGSNGGYSGETRCWINSSLLLYLTLICPIFMIILCNLILFGFILQSIYHRNTIVVSHQKYHAKLQIGGTLCCFVSIGCTWLFGILVIVQPNFLHQFIFCISNSLQGFFIFLFHVYLSKPKREFLQIIFAKRRPPPPPPPKHSQSSSNQLEIAAISQSNGKLSRPIHFRLTTTQSSNSNA